MTSSAQPAPAAGPVVGLDLGGTKIAAALLAADGTVLARHSRPTPAQEGAAAVLDALAAAAAEVDPTHGASVLGIAAAGVIDPRSGMVTSATDSIRGWAGTPLGVGLANRTGYAVACDNDVRATAGPELAALNARTAGHGSLLFAAIGTGVGGAGGAAGRVLDGSAGHAGRQGQVPRPAAPGRPGPGGAPRPR
ncbi:ROK family protein, partial [Streptomyces sp. NPDC047939]|uniref:ROK family protein n=1 Tax=Streptomyces sp. NPDC047939 TaxID=3155381 RepID=UPI00341D5C94